MVGAVILEATPKGKKSLFGKWLDSEAPYFGTTKKADETLPGDPSKPLYIFNVRKWDESDKKSKQASRESESQFRFDVGNRLLNDKNPGGLAITEKDKQPVVQNSVPLYPGANNKWLTALKKKQFNGVAIISTHSGVSPRRRAKDMEAGGNKGDAYPADIANTYVRPLLANPVTLDKLILFSCNSGTRLREEVVGSSFADKLLGEVETMVKDEELNGGKIPEIWGANGFVMVKGEIGQPAHVRVHSRYSPDAKTERKCNDGKTKWCDFDYNEYHEASYAALMDNIPTAQKNGKPAWVQAVAPPAGGNAAEAAAEEEDGFPVAKVPLPSSFPGCQVFPDGTCLTWTQPAETLDGRAVKVLPVAIPTFFSSLAILLP